jgi:hypothetical protein
LAAPFFALERGATHRRYRSQPVASALAHCGWPFLLARAAMAMWSYGTWRMAVAELDDLGDAQRRNVGQHSLQRCSVAMDIGDGCKPHRPSSLEGRPMTSSLQACRGSRSL